MDVAFDFVGKDNDGLGYGSNMSTNLWIHGRDIFGHKSLHEDNDGLGYGSNMSTNLWIHGRDIFGHKSLHEEFKIDFCNEFFEFLLQHGMIGIDVAFTSRNNGSGADLEFTRVIKFEKDFVLKYLKSFVGSVVEKDSSSVKNSLCWTV
nr:hypothetical protein [Tanacetum cinerariifolium]